MVILMVSQWNLSDSKSPQFFRTLLLANFNVLVLMVSISLISKSSSPFTNPLEISQVHIPQLVSPSSSFSIVFLGGGVFFFTRSRYFSLFAFFYFHAEVYQDGKAYNTTGSLLFYFFAFFYFFFFLLTITWSGSLAEIWWSVCISKSHSPGQILCCSYYYYYYYYYY